jgi:hypothetical protein
MENSDNIFSISVEWVQLEAMELINRRLTDDELSSVKKGIDSALLFDIDTVFKTAIKNAAEFSNEEK